MEKDNSMSCTSLNEEKRNEARKMLEEKIFPIVMNYFNHYGKSDEVSMTLYNHGVYFSCFPGTFYPLKLDASAYYEYLDILKERCIEGSGVVSLETSFSQEKIKTRAKEWHIVCKKCTKEFYQMK